MRTAFLILATLLASPVWAQICPDPALRPTFSPPPGREDAPLWASAESVEFTGEEGARLEGNVLLERADQRLATDLLLFDQQDQQVIMPGRVNYQDSLLQLDASAADYNLAQDEGEFSGVTYRFMQAAGNGKADAIRLYGQQRGELEGFGYTTCDAADPEWWLSASKVTLYPEKGYATARNATLRLQDVPILYVPWLQFPIDDRRKSGLLYPSFASSNDNGFQIEQPVYWNIAPNMDATFTPTLITDRGVGLGTEFRYLSRQNRGQADVFYLPDDDRTGEDRYRYRLRHVTAFSPRWRGSLFVNRVSDTDYFEDFGSGLIETSRQFLRSAADLKGEGRYWSLALLTDDFQVLDQAVGPSQEPYSRVPRIYYEMDRPLSFAGLPLDFTLDSELVYFERETGVTGARLDLLPRVIARFENAAGFIRPGLGFRFTSYELNDTEPGMDSDPTRAVPIATLDTGLYFERLKADGGVQTLEPRLFYLNVPFEEQDDLPDFDTAELTFGFAQLFATNRFTGADRQAEANQITLALTSRSFSGEDGREQWSLSLGQIIFFEDQDVVLAGDTDADREFSALVSELTWHPLANLSTRFGLQWDWEDSDLELGVLGARWRGARGQQVAFDYRFRRDRVDQFDIRLSWPLNERWRLINRWNYSFDESETLEALGGLEYNSCCWALRLLGRRYLRSREGDYRNGIFLELELKGLGSIGRSPYRLFRPEEFRF